MALAVTANGNTTSESPVPLCWSDAACRAAKARLSTFLDTQGVDTGIDVQVQHQTVECGGTRYGMVDPSPFGHCDAVAEISFGPEVMAWLAARDAQSDLSCSGCMPAV
jgi:hypothetical protein